MIELNKFRQRIKNAGKTSEYRMPISDAKALLAEVDKLLTKSTTKLQEKPFKMAEPEPTVTIKILDGGTF